MASKVARALGSVAGRSEHAGLSRASVAPLTCAGGLQYRSNLYQRPYIHARISKASRQYATLTPSRAIVASEPGPQHHGGENWAMTDIKVPNELKEGEILVEMVATGICHTDIALTNPHMGQTFPMVPGHEGMLQQDFSLSLRSVCALTVFIRLWIRQGSRSWS